MITLFIIPTPAVRVDTESVYGDILRDDAKNFNRIFYAFIVGKNVE